MARVAFIAAGAFELQPLRNRQRPAGWACFSQGPGFRLARAAAQRAAASGPWDAMVSVGVCGALAEDLRCGDIVVDAHSETPRTSRPYRQGRVVSQDRVAVTQEDKRKLAAEGIAVEMESAAVRAVAAEHGVRFYCVKAVSDTAGEGFPLDFNAYRDIEGRFQLGRIALATLARPWVVPDLVHLQRRAKEAAEKLGEFLVHCEF